ncbi:MAG: enoyl-CoA hydratase [Candidatus Contendobacter odensis]|uniref:Enoyl-CoA hydratase n=1 Tax=Candidatus Contendibacter odensensis TaxID=1400860 RepID=A0A2G6PGI9_9GAMM|nr:MAG: enoyl-CoA hydratase [Candidatus Contendobacter odensis]
MVENKLFNEIQVGDQASLTHVLDQESVEAMAIITGNFSLIDLDPSPADSSAFGQGGGQTGWSAALFATLAGTRLPGLGAVARHIDVHLRRPVAIGTSVTATATVTAKREETRTIVLQCRATDPAGNEVAAGVLEVVASEKKMQFPLRELPQVQLRRNNRFARLLKDCENLPALDCAVVHPCSGDSLCGAADAAAKGLIDPILIGPEERIRAMAEEEGIDISSYRLINSKHSHHSAELAVSMVLSGGAQTLMKGSLHTDELLSAVVKKQGGLRTERRISHCFLLATPSYPRPFIVTDAAINILPTLEIKRDIIQNAIDLTHAMKISEPKVAILSAVETVTGKIPSTLAAAALCKMADRGQITGGILDGPLAFDNAVDVQAARTKGIKSPVAGKADILIVPDLESGNMLAKQLTFMAGAEAAGLVLGARVPIVLTSRADSARTRLVSCAVAVLFAKAQRRGESLSKATG